MPANVQTMMYVGEKPWHGIGTVLDHPPTALEAIQASGLDWDVELQSLKTEKDIVLTEKKAIVRLDNNEVLGTVGNRFKYVQNKAAFSFFDGPVSEGLAEYHTAGALGKGEKIWVLAKMPDNVKVAKNDEVGKFLLFTNSHDGKGAVRMFFTPIRVVCSNTLNVAMTKAIGQGISLRHVGNIDEKLAAAQDAMHKAITYYSTFDENAKILTKTQIDEVKFNKFIKAVFPAPYKVESSKVKNLIDKVRENFEEEGRVLPNIAGTAWALFNGYVGYVDYQRATKGENEVDRKSNKLSSIWFDSGVKFKQMAWDSVMKMSV